MSANISTKEITNFAVPRSFLPELQISFFLHGKWSRGHILTKDRQWQTPGTPRKSGFSARKSPKEGERVARRHFHERVGESPRSDENFGTTEFYTVRFRFCSSALNLSCYSSVALVANCATIICIGSKFGHRVAPLALVLKLATSLYHCSATLSWIALLALSVGIELVSPLARVTSVKFHKGVLVTDIRTQLSDPRFTWVR